MHLKEKSIFDIQKQKTVATYLSNKKFIYYSKGCLARNLQQFTVYF